MELVDGTRKASIYAPEDVISRMPENVITNIMDHLPIHDAVRTSILSRNWRFKWTLLSQLVFDENFFKYLLGSGGNTQYFNEGKITRLLLHLKGGIRNFVLYISPDYMVFDVEDINHWIMFLARNGIKEFTLTNRQETPLKLPTHFFSCLQLKILKLHNCWFHPPLGFHGFPNLLSLELRQVIFHDYEYGELIASCNLLESLKIFDGNLGGEMKLVETAKLRNLKTLSLSLCLLHNMARIRCSTVIQHMSLLPKLQGLCLDFRNCKFLAEVGAQSCVSTSFPYLESLILFKIDFSSDAMLSLALGMISGSPNLLYVRIKAKYENDIPPSELGFINLDCIKMRQLQLRKMVLESSRGSCNEACLIKSILACSPMLKKIVIHSLKLDGGNEKFNFARKLLKLHRASPTAEIVI